MRFLPMLAALALLTFTPACFISREKVNTPLDMEKTAKLVPGTSTADDVLEILGAPMDVVQLGRRSAWRYDYSEGKRAGFTIIVLTMINSDIRQDRAWVFFDENDTLTHIGGTYEAKDVEYKLPYQD